MGKNAGHLFWSEARAPLLDAMLEAIQEAGCSPKKISRPFASEIVGDGS